MSDYNYEPTMRRLKLVQEIDAPRHKVFLMCQEKSTIMESFRVVWTPSGIVIYGDLCPNNNRGCTSIHGGYTVEWFAGHLSPSYLCEKFLVHGWHQELCVEDLRKMLDPEEWGSFWKDGEAVPPEVLEEIEFGLIPRVDGNEIEGCGLYGELSDLGVCTDYLGECFPGSGYDPRDVALLVAIQKRFAQLYHHDLMKDLP